MKSSPARRVQGTKIGWGVAQGPESVAEVRDKTEAAVEGTPSGAWSDSLGAPKLSKVDEVQSSMERGSDSESDGIFTIDNQGRQGKNSVLEGIHEQERSQQGSSGSRSWATASSGSSRAATTRTLSSGSTEEQCPSSGSPPTAGRPDPPGRPPAGGFLPGNASGQPPADSAAGAPAGFREQPAGRGGNAGASAAATAADLQQLTPFAAASQAATGLSGSLGSDKDEGRSDKQRSDHQGRGGRALGKLWASGKKALSRP